MDCLLNSLHCSRYKTGNTAYHLISVLSALVQGKLNNKLSNPFGVAAKGNIICLVLGHWAINQV